MIGAEITEFLHVNVAILETFDTSIDNRESRDRPLSNGSDTVVRRGCGAGSLESPAC